MGTLYYPHTNILTCNYCQPLLYLLVRCNPALVLVAHHSPSKLIGINRADHKHLDKNRRAQSLKVDSITQEPRRLCTLRKGSRPRELKTLGLGPGGNEDNRCRDRHRPRPQDCVSGHPTNTHETRKSNSQPKGIPGMGDDVFSHIHSTSYHQGGLGHRYG